MNGRQIESVRRQKIYSDNTKSFVAAAKGLEQIMTNERLIQLVLRTRNQVVVQREQSTLVGWTAREVSFLKQAFYRSVGNNLLSWSELQDVLLDVEVALNNRPLSYVEDDVQLPELTPNALLLCGRPNRLPEVDYQNLDEHELRRRAKCLRQCKDLNSVGEIDKRVPQGASKKGTTLNTTQSSFRCRLEMW